MTQHTLRNRITRAAISALIIAGLFAAIGADTTAHADGPPKKADGKVKFVVGQVTAKPDKDGKKQPDPPKKPDPGKGKQPGPKGN